ncbi:MAG: hypothetical protein GF375_05240 [Candidatus Omnitrophica bacterium]|nr:hypothetical protein [Candidatus Omnitrophota bacterium]MBD3269393.1 hypothetical protein [Candidatus Omnitrophota bacterium]
MIFLIDFSRYFGLAAVSLLILSGAVWLFVAYRLRIQKGEIDFSIKQLQIYLHLVGSPSVEIDRKSILENAGREVKGLVSEREMIKEKISTLPAREGGNAKVSGEEEAYRKKHKDNINKIESLNHNIGLISEKIDIVNRQIGQETLIKNKALLFIKISFFLLLYCIFWWTGIKIFPIQESFISYGAALSILALAALWFLATSICSISWYVVKEKEREYEPAAVLKRERSVMAGVVAASIFIFLLAHSGIIEGTEQKKKIIDSAVMLFIFGYPAYLLYRLFGWVNERILIEKEGGQ